MRLTCYTPFPIAPQRHSGIAQLAEGVALARDTVLRISSITTRYRSNRNHRLRRFRRWRRQASIGICVIGVICGCCFSLDLAELRDAQWLAPHAVATLSCSTGIRAIAVSTRARISALSVGMRCPVRIQIISLGSRAAL